MGQSPQAAARRYARALLEVALAKGDPAALRAELQQVSALIGSNRPLHDALTHPGLAGEKRRELVASVFASGSPLLQRLLLMLAERGRIALVPHVAAAFARAWNEERGVVAAEVVSAVALDASQQGALAAALGKLSGRSVELRQSVDPGVLGGLIVTMGGSIFDGSVRAQLRALRQRLARGAVA